MPAIENQTLSKLYYSIGEVADMLHVNPSLLRFWEKEFNLTVSKKNKKGNRLFSVKEIEQIKRIYHFVKVEGYTLDGAKKALKQKAAGTLLITPSESTVDEIATTIQRSDFSELIEKLEDIKSKLLRITRVKEEEEQKQTVNAPLTATEPKEETSHAPASTAPSAASVTKKRSSEKPKPASDMPTLFDF
ncbi:MAG: MerR family transcriptional regulator [Flavobacteriales bacterium]